MKQIGIDSEVFEKKTIEVRNKIDLVEERRQVQLIIENQNSLRSVDQSSALENKTEGHELLIHESVEEDKEELRKR